MQPAAPDAGRADAEGERVEVLHVEADHQRAGVVVGAGADRLAGERVAEEGEQRRRHRHRGKRRVDLVGIDDQRPDGEARERIGRLHALRVGAEDDEQAVHQDQRHRHQQHELAVLGPVDERIDQPALHDVAEREQHGRDRHHHRQRVEAVVREQHHREVHGDGHHLAVGEIDHAHDAEDDRQAERHQPVDEAGQQAADGDVEVDFCGHRRSCQREQLRPRRDRSGRALSELQPRLS